MRKKDPNAKTPAFHRGPRALERALQVQAAPEKLWAAAASCWTLPGSSSPGCCARGSAGPWHHGAVRVQPVAPSPPAALVRCVSTEGGNNDKKIKKKNKHKDWSEIKRREGDLRGGDGSAGGWGPEGAVLAACRTTATPLPAASQPSSPLLIPEPPQNHLKTHP